MIRKDEKTDKKDYPGELELDPNHKGGRMNKLELTNHLPNISDFSPAQLYYYNRLGLFAGSLYRAIRDASALNADVEMKLINKKHAIDQLEHYRLSVLEDIEAIMGYAKDLGLVKG